MTNNILYCVLNWGLGHASRSIPIIEKLIHEGNQLTIASDGASLKLLEDAFPKLPLHPLPPYDIQYKHESIAANILSQSIKILRAIKKERQYVSDLVSSHQFTKIISDNRYGCYHESCHNIFVTHQLRLLHPRRFIQAAASKMNLGMISKFDECWIPDSADSALSGKMSSEIEIDIPLKYIGPQSRFTKIDVAKNPIYHTLSILSGPEPQRTFLQEKITAQVTKIEGRHLIVTGIEEANYQIENIEFIGLTNQIELSKLIAQSKYLISRSGYSSIMDYEAMKRKAILIPTPGQTEQTYIGKLLGEKGRHIVLAQDNLELKKVCV